MNRSAPKRRLSAAAILCLTALLAPGAAGAAPLLLVDAETGAVLYEQDASQSWHPASLTKLMTAHLALRAVAAGRASFSTPVVMTAHAAAQPPSKLGLPVGDTLTLGDALRVMLVRSTNDVAVAIAETLGGGSEAVFVQAMNAEAVRLNMDATYFVNANGLHDERQVTTARDMALLGMAIRKAHPRHLDLFATPSVTVSGRKMKNTNPLMGKYPGIDGMKTGYVCASGFNLVATAHRGGRELMAVVLGAPSGKARGENAAALLESGFSGASRASGDLKALFRPFPVRAMDLRKFACGKSLG
ncbi:D-alanyl-D-alanine carboxypeptidase family protein [Aureimonas glaciei]|uniref:Peptidase S11 D-alanyl-D-alanine carboxypeptidase A N-terminal domain-containing protein n=1 Tax=Aureimonas glaciei TaxID=1776957 RepID=A0A916XUK4_9HYPH|nr:D-alanyl-D-alanine carboxypeptidase family protein [Aureimonas glaciei]GGD12090.1 hypothetical protein GCM10011335_13740 [Aureimonas glaciei]